VGRIFIENKERVLIIGFEITNSRVQIDEEKWQYNTAVLILVYIHYFNYITVGPDDLPIM
jgi:hypothetical protein